jgi:glycosyltransferase involved in cell wall biosynthesis
MYKLLALAPNPWYGLWMNRQQLLSRLGASRPVLYANGVWDSWQVPSQAWLASPLLGRTVRNFNVDVDVPGFFEVRWQHFRLLDRTVTRLVGRRWRHALGRFDGPLIAHLFYPSYIDYVRDIAPDAIVYHVYDLYSSQPGWTPELGERERELVSRASAVIASSDDQAEYLEGIGGRPVNRVYNAVDYRAFSTAGAHPVPGDVAAIPRPRIGYVGRINKKVDLPLLAQLAQRRREWSLVMVGPVVDLDAECRAAFEEMRQLPNVHFLGSKDQSLLGRYMSVNDVNLMCYRVDRGWIRYAYPLKMHEYLATGVPVVSSNLRSVATFRDVIDVASTVDDWDAAVTRALQDRSDESMRKRKAVAAMNDWSVRVEQLDEILLGVASSVRYPQSANRGRRGHLAGRIGGSGV